MVIRLTNGTNQLKIYIMKTNLNNPCSFVLNDGESNIIGVIKADAGLTDIESRIITALSEYFDAESVIIKDQKILTLGDNVSFDCEIAVPGEEDYQEHTLYLTSVAEY